MGSDRPKGHSLAVRCCHGACFGIGFLVTALCCSVMFWIVWCYLGLSIVQVSDTQRRALVNYSVTSSATPPQVETSANAISRFATASTVASRLLGRGGPPLASDKGQKSSDRPPVSATAKGDFADRNRANVTVRTSESPRIAHSHNESTVAPSSVEDSKKSPILNGGEEGAIYLRRVSTSDSQPLNSPKKEPDLPRVDIAPTQVYGDETKENGPTDNRTSADGGKYKPPPRIYLDSSLPRRDDIQSSRRSSTDSAIRDPDFERDYPSRSTARERSRYEDDDVRGLRGRYDKRDRGPYDTDDGQSKGDTRVFPVDRRPDEDRHRDRTPVDEDRYLPRDRYDERRRGDDERYRDTYRGRDDAYRSREDDRPRDRGDTIRDRGYPIRDQDDRKKDRDDAYRDQDNRKKDRDDTYRDHDDRKKDRDDVYRDRKDDRHRDHDRDDPRYREDEKLRTARYPEDRSKDDEDRYRDRAHDDRRYTDRDGEYSYSERTQEDRRYLDSETYRYRPRDDKERYRDDEGRPVSSSRSGDLPPVDRRPVRPDTSVRDDGKVSVRDRSRTYDLVEPRPSDDDLYRDDDYRPPSRRDDRDRIAPTRVRDEYSGSKSTPSLLRDDSRSSDERLRDRESSKTYERLPDDRIRSTRYQDDDDRRVENSRLMSSSPSVVESDSSRRSSDDREYRTRLSDDREYRSRTSDERKSDGRRDEVILDRRSYSTDEVDEFRRGDSRTRLASDEYRDDDKYVRRIRPGDEEYVRRSGPDSDEYRRSKPRGDSDSDRPRYGDDDRLPSRKYDRPVDDRTRRRDRDDAEERTRRRDPDDFDDRTRRRDPDDADDRTRRRYPDDADDRTRRRDRYDADDRTRRRDPDDNVDRTRRLDRDDADERTRRRDPDDADDRARRREWNESRKEFSTRDSSMDSRDRRYHPTDIEDRPSRSSRRDDDPRRTSRYPDDDRSPHSQTSRRDNPTGSAMSPATPRMSEDKEAKGMERPLSAQDVIEAAQRHADPPDQNPRKVFYPVFDPRVSNLTSPELIRPSERRGITLASRRKRRNLKQ